MLFRKTVRIVIRNQNMAVEAKTGQNLYQVLVNEKIIQPTLCRGSGQCGKCKVHITQKNLSKPTKREQLVLARINLDAGYRLACQTTVKQDMVVDTSEITNSSVIEDIPVLVKVRKESNAESIAESLETFHNQENSTEEQVVENEQKTEPKKNLVPTTIQTIKNIEDFTRLDGLLMVESKKNLRYFLYSASIDGISQEGTIEDSSELNSYIESGMLSDFIHSVLKIRDIDRVIILSDRQSREGENLFDAASYVNFDIGSLPCEFIRPLPEAGDLSPFLRVINSKGKKKLMISLDKLNLSYYFDDDFVASLPKIESGFSNNIFDELPGGVNPVASISGDLKTVKAAKEFLPPDNVPLPILLKIVSIMKQMKIVDENLVIQPRTELDPSVPLDFVVKVMQDGQNNAFYIYRDKEASLILRQNVLDILNVYKDQILYDIEYAEESFGNIEIISVNTPTPMAGLGEALVELGFIPKKYQGAVVNNSGESFVSAIKLFQEKNVHSYIQKNLGSYRKFD